MFKRWGFSRFFPVPPCGANFELICMFCLFAPHPLPRALQVPRGRICHTIVSLSGVSRQLGIKGFFV